MTGPSLCVIPRPQQISYGEGAFRPNAETCILLMPDTDEADWFAAQSLQEELRRSLALETSIIKTSDAPRERNIIALSRDNSLLSDRLVAENGGDEGANPSTQHQAQQSCALDITDERVLIVGAGAAGLYYGVQTLRQIVRTAGPSWPACQIADWPRIAYRGLMLDVSRGKVPTLDTLKLLVDQLSHYKANVLQLYTEHTFRFPHHPRIGQGCGSLSGENMLELDTYCRQRHVELMPNLNSFGHCAHVLNMPDYAHLAESAARWSLCPTIEETYTFLDELYGDMLPAFRSTTFNVGCDETYDLGHGRSAEAVAERGTGRVYLEHLLRLRELAARYGRAIQVWGDILLHYPDLVPELPEDITLLDWHYEAAEDYPSVELFAESGRRFWVCPGTSSWNTLFPRIENSNGNIRTLARLGAQHGAEGLLNTDWGDYGHYQPIGQCWYSYIFGAEQGWNGGETEEEAFDACFGPLFFGAGGDKVVRAMRLLGRLNTLLGMARSNASHSIYALLDEPLVGPMIDEIPAETLEQVISGCAEAESLLREAHAQSSDALSIEEMIYSVRMMDYAARKQSASQRLRAALDRLAEGQDQDVAQERLQEGIETLRAFEAELVTLTDYFREIWLCRARHAEIDITLGHLDRLRQRFRAAQEWLSARFDALESGQTPDYDLSPYTQEAEGYEILGQSFRRLLREVGVRP